MSDSNFHSISVELSPAQIRKIIKKGPGGVRLSHTSLIGRHELLVDARTARRHKRAHRKMTGMVIPHSAIYGGSIFDDAKSAIKKYAGQAIREHVIPFAQKKLGELADNGLTKVGLGVRHKVRRAKRGAVLPMFDMPDPRRLRGMSSGIPVNAQGSGFTPGEVRGMGRRRGGNIFGDIGDYFSKPSNILNTLGTVASYLPLPGAGYAAKGLDLAGRAASALGHGVGKRKGKGLYLPGTGGGLF